MTVLIIDDDSDDTDLFCEAFAELFPDSICLVKKSCLNVDAILKRHQQLDVIFLDGYMFPIDGKDCLRLLKAVDGIDDTKIVIHSGSLSPVQLDELAAEGVDDIILKASSYNVLKSNLQELLLHKYALK